MNNTIFSTREFVTAWSRHFGTRLRPFALTVEVKNAPRTVYAVATHGRTGLIAIEFGPSGFCASPGWETALVDGTVDGLLHQLCGTRIRSFTWNVRFDHEALAKALERRGLVGNRIKTQVLRLVGDHEKTFSNYLATLRNHVRKGRKRCVVSTAECAEELTGYYALHERLRQAKGDYHFVFPEGFLLDLVKLRGQTRFLVARLDRRIVAGAIYLRDGDSICYVHGAYDQQFSNAYPSVAVMDEAIRWANEVGAKTFNFGGSAGIKSLEAFKASWGAEFRETWRFSWRNPLWAGLESAMGLRKRC